MSNIHPTAVIESGARIAPEAYVGPMCHIGPKVTIGPGTRLVSHVVIMGRTTLGSGNTLWPQVTLGADPQDLKFQGEDSQVVIGDGNELRESVTIHLGTDNGGSLTRLGHDNMIMVGCHIAHDCHIGDHVVLANQVQLAGHIRINDHVVISGACAVHHFVTIGQNAFVGGMSRIVHDVPPFMIVEGNPAKVRGVNAVGLKRHRFPPESISRLKDAYRRLFRTVTPDADKPAPPPNMAQNLGKVQVDYPDDECIQLLVRFLRNTSIGLHGRYLESERNDNRHQNPVK